MWRFVTVLALGLCVSTTLQAGSLPLQSHLAVYELSLRSARQSAGITDLTGRLVLEWAKDCEGYIVNQRMLTEVTSARGDNVLNDFNVTTWESLDGLRFRYSSRNEIPGTPVEQVTGRAELSGPGAGGTARFSEPEAATFKLPAGAVFPTEQVGLLLIAAAEGKKTRNILVFDGSRTDGLFDTFNVIGAERPPLSEAEAGDSKLLAGLASWPVHTAYFPRTPPEDLPPGTPEFEVAFRLFQNGVATEVVFDYGSFAMDATLSELKALPKPDC